MRYASKSSRRRKATGRAILAINVVLTLMLCLWVRAAMEHDKAHGISAQQSLEEWGL